MSTPPRQDSPHPRQRGDLVAFAAYAALWGALQASFDRVIGSDGFFHVRQAARVLQGGMPWMPGTVFDAGWVDHQLLFHLALAPFAWTLPGVVAAKAGAACLGALAPTALRGVLARAGVRGAWLLALLPCLSWLWWLRLEMPRAQGPSVALVLIGLWLLAEGRHRATAALAALFVWTYHVAFVLLPIAVLFALLRAPRDRGAWRGVAAVIAGLGGGLVLHPHSPGTLRFAWQHVVLKVVNRDALPVGQEWVDGGWDVLRDHGSWPLLLLLAAAPGWRRTDRHASLFRAAWLVGLGATIALLSGSRFVEYAAPLAALALGLAWPDGPGIRRPLRVALAVGLAAALVSSGARIRTAVLQGEPPPDARAAAAGFLRAHATPGERVFHLHWNDFPELVFWAPEFRYVVGLDPHFLALADPARWRLYDALGGAYPGRRSDAIREAFGARWVVASLPHPGARAALDADPGLRLEFADRWALVYAVVAPSRDNEVAPP